MDIFELLEVRGSTFLYLEALLNNNSIEDFMRWVMILLCVKLFLRCDEIVNLSFDDFITSLFIIDDFNNIDAIGIKIKGYHFNIIGKSDHKWYKFYLWRDYQQPLLCPVIHLLIYIYYSNLKQANYHIFPNQTTLKDLQSTEKNINGLIKCFNLKCVKCFPEKLLQNAPGIIFFIKVKKLI